MSACLISLADTRQLHHLETRIVAFMLNRWPWRMVPDLGASHQRPQL
jgi:hypothetical protein